MCYANSSLGELIMAMLPRTFALAFVAGLLVPSASLAQTYPSKPVRMIVPFGPGTPYHMAAELFKAMSGTDIVHVPHKSSGDMRSSVIGGHVQMMFDAITVMAEGVRSGQLVALGTTGEKRSSVMPEVPTV